LKFELVTVSSTFGFMSVGTLARKRCCAESDTENQDGKKQTRSGCFDFDYRAHPKIRDEAHNKPKAGCLHSLSRKGSHPRGTEVLRLTAFCLF
jgi:hypothetical protein